MERRFFFWFIKLFIALFVEYVIIILNNPFGGNKTKADNIKLSEFVSSGKRAFCIPVYQRNYDWKKNECVTLFRDIEKIAVSKKRSSHFLGTLSMFSAKIPAQLTMSTL